MSAAGVDLRNRILDRFTDRTTEWSTAGLGALLREKPATINYHVGVLRADDKLIRVRSVPRRGSVEYFYRRAVIARG